MSRMQNADVKLDFRLKPQGDNPLVTKVCRGERVNETAPETLSNHAAMRAAN
jgi:hypothetical protein